MSISRTLSDIVNSVQRRTNSDKLIYLRGIDHKPARRSWKKRIGLS